MIDWVHVLDVTAIIICIIFVFLGAVPILAMAYQFLVIPLHAYKNHYRGAAPYQPRVSVVVPAWNEGAVIGTTIDRMLSLEYPMNKLRIYVVDDASTDETPEVVQAKQAEYPGQVFHLRREKGGEGKAHTLNFGLQQILADDWMEALLITDADVIFLPDSLSKLTRHLADPRVGAVTAYIREGSQKKNFMNRFIAFEYALSQAASRRGQNVLGAVACLAGGAQLHSRENLVAVGGRIDTTTLAEDTVTTFKTQLAGRRVVFEPYAIVLAEEPRTINGLWKQRLRWARGNVQLTKLYKWVWLRPSKDHNLGTISFTIFWFTIFLLPVAMILSSIGLIGLFLLDSALESTMFKAVWGLAACTFVYTSIVGAELDPPTGRSSWREAMFFPGFISVLITFMTFFPGVLEEDVPSFLGVTIPRTWFTTWTIFTYIWVTLSMVVAWSIKKLEPTKVGKILTPFLVYLVGYGPFLCAITFDSYIKEFRKADNTWEKTEKTGNVIS